MFFPVLSPGRSQRLYEEAQRKCGNQIWLVIEDVGPVVTQIKAPYPEQYSGDLITGYSCTQAQAEKVASEHSEWNWFSLAFLIVAPIVGFVGIVMILTWLTSLMLRRRQ